jgi:hypothetical protein
VEDNINPNNRERKGKKKKKKKLVLALAGLSSYLCSLCAMCQSVQARGWYPPHHNGVFHSEMSGPRSGPWIRWPPLFRLPQSAALVIPRRLVGDGIRQDYRCQACMAYDPCMCEDCLVSSSSLAIFWSRRVERRKGLRLASRCFGKFGASQ